ncbi:MAG: L-fucose/L-arabinose isomerase family protein [Candidatus Ratteibacteria bacterium]
MKNTPIGIVMMNDERQHVWEQNEKDNMAVLHQWADFLKKNLQDKTGSCPEIVVGSETIKSITTARKVGEELVRKGCRQVIMCYNVWDFPYLVWPFIQTVGIDKPILSLSNNNGAYPGNVGLLATDGALRQAGIRTYRIVGEITDSLTQQKVLKWVRASQAAACIKNEVYGCYGGHSMGMETGYFHLVPTVKHFGTTVYQIDQLLLVKMMEQVSSKEVEKGFRWFSEMLGDRIKYDGKMLTPETLKKQISLYLAMKKVNEEYDFDFCGLKGQRELTEHVCLGDVPEMLMNDPYDWNGSKEPFVCATEADSYAALTMQILKYISGGLPVLFMDVRLYHPDLDIWDFCNSGNHASYYASLSDDPKENFAKITFHPALEFYFKAGGASVEFDAAPGILTFARLGLWDDRPYMVIMKGESLALNKDMRRKINDQTNPTWPHVHARLECNFENFLKVFPCNHILAVSGDCVESLKYFCDICKISAIIPGRDTEVENIWQLVR